MARQLEPLKKATGDFPFWDRHYREDKSGAIPARELGPASSPASRQRQQEGGFVVPCLTANPLSVLVRGGNNADLWRGG